MRIVELVPSLSVGGAERVAALLAGELRRGGHEVVVVALGPATGSWIEAGLAAEGVETRFLGKGPGLDPAVVPRLLGALRAARPDVVHTHLHVLKYLLPVQRRWGRVVHTLHNLAEHEAAPHDRRVQQVAFRAGVTAVAIGDAVARSMLPVYGRGPGRVIPNGIPVTTMQAPGGARAQVRAALGVAPDTKVLLSAGRLNPQKNHAALVEAMADPRLAGAELWIAGDGELRGALEAQALGRRVRLLGVRSDMPALFAAADVFVLPSTFEGNPLVVMEAMAAGLPVVASAVGCVPELLTPETGRLVPPGDVPALATALAGLLDVEGRVGTMGAAAGRRAVERFDVARMGDAYAGLFEERVRGGFASSRGAADVAADRRVTPSTDRGA